MFSIFPTISLSFTTVSFISWVKELIFIKPVTVQIEEQPPVEIEVLEVSISSSWTSHAYPGKEITRTITFYVYKRGINWRP
ncbi:hypothetical protein ES703_91146 [subsurface metagenome]